MKRACQCCVRAVSRQSRIVDQSPIQAKKINLGAAACRGEFLLLLNDDVEPLNKDWIERLLDHMWKPHVGVVGAKLLSAT